MEDTDTLDIAERDRLRDEESNRVQAEDILKSHGLESPNPSDHPMFDDGVETPSPSAGEPPASDNSYGEIRAPKDTWRSRITDFNEGFKDLGGHNYLQPAEYDDGGFLDVVGQSILGGTTDAVNNVYDLFAFFGHMGKDAITGQGVSPSRSWNKAFDRKTDLLWYPESQALFPQLMRNFVSYAITDKWALKGLEFAGKAAPFALAGLSKAGGKVASALERTPTWERTGLSAERIAELSKSGRSPAEFMPETAFGRMTGRVSARAAEIGASTLFEKYGPGIQKVLNSPNFRQAASSMMAASMMRTEGENISKILSDNGYGMILFDYMASDEGDTATEKSFKLACEALTMHFALKGGGFVLGGIAKGSYGAAVYGMARAARYWNRLQQADPQGAATVAEIVAGASGKNFKGDAIADVYGRNFQDSATFTGSSKVAAEQAAQTRSARAADLARARVERLRGKTNPDAGKILNKTMAESIATEPSLSPGTQEQIKIGEKLAIESATEAAVRKDPLYSMNIDERTQELRRIFEEAYMRGDISQLKIMASKYSSDFWKSVKRGYEDAGRPLSKTQLRFLRKMYDNMATHWANASGNSPEAYYWYKFGNRSYDAVRVIEDMGLDPATIGSRFANPLDPAIHVVGYDGHPNSGLEVPGVNGRSDARSARFYTLNDDMSMNRVNYSHKPEALASMLDVSESYADLANRIGKDKARELLLLMDDSLKETSPGMSPLNRSMRQGAEEQIVTRSPEEKDALVESILTEPRYSTGKIGLDFDRYVSDVLAKEGDNATEKLTEFYDKLKELGWTGTSDSTGKGSFTRTFFNRSDVSTSLAGTKVNWHHKPIQVSPEEIARARVAGSAEATELISMAEEASVLNQGADDMDAALNALQQDPGYQAIRDAMDTALDAAIRGPNEEYVAVTRARGYAHAGAPDGEYVVVSTNPKTPGDKLWVKVSDIVAPGNARRGEFFARTKDVVPIEEFNTTTDLKQLSEHGAVKGAVEFDERSRAIINLVKGKADFSTMIHESAHLFFDDLKFLPDLGLEVGARETAEGRAGITLLDSLSEWLGVDSAEITQFNQWSEAAQEKWARGFERYVATGKAPNGEIEPMFKLASRWMKQIYTPILHSPIAEKAPPEIQDFMAKLVGGTEVKLSPYGFGDKKESPKKFSYTPITDEEDVIKLMEHFRVNDTGLQMNNETMKFDQVMALARKQNRSLPDLLGLPEGTLSDIDSYHLARYLQASGNELLIAMREAQSGDVGAVAAVKKLMVLQRTVMLRWIDEGTVTARKMNLRKLAASSVKYDRKYAKGIKEIIEQYDHENYVELSKICVAAAGKSGDVTKIIPILQKVDQPGFFDVLHEIYINNLLFSPKTMLSNASSGAIVVGHQYGVTKAASGVNKFIGRSGIDQGEVDAMWQGISRGSTEGFVLAREMISDKWIDVSGSNKWGTQSGHAFQSKAFVTEGWAKDKGDIGKVVQNALDGIGAAWRLPSRTLRATDGFYKSILYRMNLHRLAYRNAMSAFEKELEAGPKKGEMFAQLSKTGGPAEEWVARRMEEYLANPPIADILESRKFATYHTFQEGLQSKFGRDMARIGSKTPIVRKVVPFMRAALEISRYSVREFTPLGVVSKDFRSRLFSKDDRVRQFAQTQLGLSTAALLSICDAQNRGLLTGHYAVGMSASAKRQTQKAKGVAEHAIHFTPDGAYFGVHRLDPVGTSLAIMQQSCEVIDKMSDTDAGEFAADVLQTVATLLVDRSSMSSISDTIAKMNDLSSSGEAIQTTIGNMIAAHIIPAYSLVSATEKAADPTLRETRVDPGIEDTGGYSNLAYRKVIRILNESRAKIPGLSDDLKPKRDLLGRPVSTLKGVNDTWYNRANSAFLPMDFGQMDEKYAPVMDAFLKNDTFPTKPSENVNYEGQTITLPFAVLDKYEELAGVYTRRNLDRIWPKVKDLADDGENGAKMTMLKTAFADGQRKALDEVTAANRPMMRGLYEKAKQKSENPKGTTWGLPSASVSKLKPN